MWNNVCPSGAQDRGLTVIYLILGLVMLLAGGGAAAWFAYQNRELRDSLAQAKAEDHSEELRREQAIRRNLQRICDRRSQEVQRQKGKLREYEATIQDLENQITQLNVTLFQESGRRILAEKDEGARRMKQELADKQLSDAKARLRAREAAAMAREDELLDRIAALEREIDRLRTSRAKHSARKIERAQEAGQISVDELLEKRD